MGKQRKDTKQSKAPEPEQLQIGLELKRRIRTKAQIAEQGHKLQLSIRVTKYEHDLITHLAMRAQQTITDYVLDAAIPGRKKI